MWDYQCSSGDTFFLVCHEQARCEQEGTFFIKHYGRDWKGLSHLPETGLGSASAGVVGRVDKLVPHFYFFRPALGRFFFVHSKTKGETLGRTKQNKTNLRFGQE